MRDEEKSLSKSLLDGLLAVAGLVWLGMIVIAMVSVVVTAWSVVRDALRGTSDPIKTADLKQKLKRGVRLWCALCLLLLSLNALVLGEWMACVLIGLAGMLLITRPWHWLDARVGPSGRNLRYGTAVVAMVVGVGLLPPPKSSVRNAQLSQPTHNAVAEQDRAPLMISRKSSDGDDRSAPPVMDESQAQSSSHRRPVPPFARNESYAQVRVVLMRDGWQPVISKDADQCMEGDTRCEGRPEMQTCSGSGLAMCRFSWQRDGQQLTICTTGEEQAMFHGVCE